MASFYGGGTGIIDNINSQLMDNVIKIEIAKYLNENIIVSKTQPENQQIGDLWFVITDE